jgi:hypothetical protein
LTELAARNRLARFPAARCGALLQGTPPPSADAAPSMALR